MRNKKKAVGETTAGAITTATNLLLSTPNYSTNHTNIQAPKFSPAVSTLLDQAQARYEAELEQARAHWRAAQQHKAIKASLETQFFGGAR